MASRERELTACKRPCDYVSFVLKSTALKKRRWAGDHLTVETDLGRMTLTNSHRELPPWLRQKIARMIVAIGLCSLIVAITVAAMI